MTWFDDILESLEPMQTQQQQDEQQQADDSQQRVSGELDNHAVFDTSVATEQQTTAIIGYLPAGLRGLGDLADSSYMDLLMLYWQPLTQQLQHMEQQATDVSSPLALCPSPQNRLGLSIGWSTQPTSAGIAADTTAWLAAAPGIDVGETVPTSAKKKL